MAFKDPIDEEADAAEAGIVGRHVQQLQEAIGEDGEVEVRDEPDEEDDPEVVAPKKSRQEKRSERMSARERAAAEKARADTLAEQLEVERRTKRENGQQQPQAPSTERIDAQLRDTYKAQENLQREYEQRYEKLSPKEHEDYRNRAIDLDVQKTSLIAQRREVIEAPRRYQEEVSRQLSRENPDVYGNPQALQYARGRVTQLLALGHQDSKELHDQVMEETRRVVLKKRPEPSAAERQRATGIPSRALGAPGREPARISMPKGSPLYRMAVAAYPDLDPDKACQKWANQNGKAFIAATGSRR